MCIGIMSAMEEEINILLEQVEDVEKKRLGGRTFWQGSLWGKPVVLVFSHWGKVAAAATASCLVAEFQVSKIIFVGVAGSLSADLCVGDVVVADRCVQYDMNASPLFPPFEIPLRGESFFVCDTHLTQRLHDATAQFLANLKQYIDLQECARFHVVEPKLVMGLVGTGDEFISSEARRKELLEALPSLQCVEMEGAAVAQVCADFSIPFGLLRIISDGANEQAAFDFNAFITSIAGQFSLHIIKAFLRSE